MKSFNKALAAGITLALASISAHAQLTTAPGINEGSAPSPNGLYLAVYNSANNQSEVVNLGSSTTDNLSTGWNYLNLTNAGGNLNPTAPNAAFKVATNPAGSGQVLQLNFGTIAGFTSAGGNIFNSSNLATDNYMVLASRSGAAPSGIEVTSAGGAPLLGAQSGLTAPETGISGEIASWFNAAPTTGDLIDTTGSATYGVTQTNGLNSGTLGGNSFSQSVGSAAAFYNVAAVAGSRSAVTNVAYAGFWDLSTTGDLTYNVSYASAAPVPLPAAIWLLGSGLLGMAGIARRRSSSV
jgi:hypothetical protein